VTAHQEQSGQLQLQNVTIDPTSVEPGGVIEVNIDIQNGAAFVGPGASLCNPPGINPTGLQAELVVDADFASTINDIQCIPASNLGAPTRTITYEFVAPELQEGEDSRTFRVDVEMNETSQEKTVSETATVRVERGGFTDPNDPGDDNGGGPGAGFISEILDAFLSRPIESVILLAGLLFAVRLT
jgi:hypothetical protein